MRRRVAVSALVALGAVVSGCAAQGEANSSSGGAPGVTDKQVSLGTTSPLTGGVASACVPLTDGAAAWFQKVNADGGVHGRKINNVVLDDVYEAPKALSNARELAAKPVFAFFGGCGTIQPPAVEGVAEPKGIPYLFPYTGLSAELNKPNFFTMIPTYGQQLKALVPWTLNKYGAGSVFLLNVKIPGSEDTEAAVKEATSAAGGKYLGTETTSPGQSDVTSLVLKIKKLNPDYVVLGQTAQDAARIVQAMAAQDAFPAKKLIGFSTLAARSFVDPAKGLADGRLVAPSVVAPWDSPDAKSCVDAFQSGSSKVVPDGFSLFGCGMAQLMTTALSETGKDLTRDGLQKTLESFDGKAVSPVLPPVSFSSSQHLGASSMWIVGVKKGHLVDEGKLALQ